MSAKPALYLTDSVLQNGYAYDALIYHKGGDDIAIRPQNDTSTIIVIPIDALRKIVDAADAVQSRVASESY